MIVYLLLNTMGYTEWLVKTVLLLSHSFMKNQLIVFKSKM